MDFTLDDMPLPTAAARAAIDACLGTVEPRPGYVIHRRALAAHRADLAAAGGYRGPWYRIRGDDRVSKLTDARLLEIAAQLDGVTPDVMTVLDALVRSIDTRTGALRQVVEARLAIHRQAMLEEYVHRIREQDDRIRALEQQAEQLRGDLAEVKERGERNARLAARANLRLVM